MNYFDTNLATQKAIRNGEFRKTPSANADAVAAACAIATD